MAGRLVFPDVPFVRTFPALLDPLCVLSNAYLYATQRAVGATLRIRWSPPPPPPSARPRIVIAWHRYNYALAHCFLDLPEAQRPTLVMHDGLASRALTHESSAWMGYETLVFHRRSSVSPRQQIVDYVRASGRGIMVLPDSGGPYERMKPGVLEIAAACDAELLPVAVRARPELSLGRRLRHVVPLPGSELTVACGALIDPREATLERCQRALDALSR